MSWCFKEYWAVLLKLSGALNCSQLSISGGAIMGGAYLLSGHHLVLITFTALLLTELVMVALTVHTWHWIMLLAELFSVTVYFTSLYLLNAYFGKKIV